MFLMLHQFIVCAMVLKKNNIMHLNLLQIITTFSFKMYTVNMYSNVIPSITDEPIFCRVSLFPSLYCM